MEFSIVTFGGDLSPFLFPFIFLGFWGRIKKGVKKIGRGLRKGYKFVKKHKKKFAIVGAVALGGVGISLGIAGKLGGFKRLKSIFSKGRGLIKRFRKRKSTPRMSRIRQVRPPRAGSSLRAVQKQASYVTPVQRQIAKEDDVGIKVFDAVTFRKFKRG